jgi:hypothetical protein
MILPDEFDRLSGFFMIDVISNKRIYLLLTLKTDEILCKAIALRKNFL